MEMQQKASNIDANIQNDQEFNYEQEIYKQYQILNSQRQSQQYVKNQQNNDNFYDFIKQQSIVDSKYQSDIKPKQSYTIQKQNKRQRSLSQNDQMQTPPIRPISHENNIQDQQSTIKDINKNNYNVDTFINQYDNNQQMPNLFQKKQQLQNNKNNNIIINKNNNNSSNDALRKSELLQNMTISKELVSTPTQKRETTNLSTQKNEKINDGNFFQNHNYNNNNKQYSGQKGFLQTVDLEQLSNFNSSYKPQQLQYYSSNKNTAKLQNILNEEIQEPDSLISSSFTQSDFESRSQFLLNSQIKPFKNYQDQQLQIKDNNDFIVPVIEGSGSQSQGKKKVLIDEINGDQFNLLLDLFKMLDFYQQGYFIDVQFNCGQYQLPLELLQICTEIIQCCLDKKKQVYFQDFIAQASILNKLAKLIQMMRQYKFEQNQQILNSHQDVNTSQTFL